MAFAILRKAFQNILNKIYYVKTLATSKFKGFTFKIQDVRLTIFHYLLFLFLLYENFPLQDQSFVKYSDNVIN